MEEEAEAEAEEEEAVMHFYRFFCNCSIDNTWQMFLDPVFVMSLISNLLISLMSEG